MNPGDDCWTTRYGELFDCFNPDPRKFRVDDVAWSLGMLCRFNGHILRFYSVAQHSVLVSRLVEFVEPELLPCAKPLAMYGLMHDAVEAYTGDMVRPNKLGLPDFRRLEDALERVAREAFGLQGAEAHDVEAIIKSGDRTALELERYCLVDPRFHGRFTWAEPPEVMDALLAVDELKDCTPRVALDSATATRVFLARHRELSA